MKFKHSIAVAGLTILTATATTAVAGTAFLTGDETSGMNKICYYDHLGSTVAITISSVKLCPLSIQV